MGLSMQAMLELLDGDGREAAETLLRTAPPPPYSRYGVAAARAMFDRVGGLAAEDSTLEVTDLEVLTTHGTVGVRAYRPKVDGVLPALIYLHGGGFVLGTLDGVDDLCRMLAVEVGCVVVSVDYRRAPEWVFPAAADDCVDVYGWLEVGSHELGIDPTRLALVGDSAGGNLALSVCTSLAAEGRSMPRCVVAAYPVTSVTFEGPSWEAFEDAPVVCKADAQWMLSMYLEDPAARVDPRAVPELSPSLHELPPLFIVSAEVDPLRSDYERFASLVAWAGGEVKLEQYDGAAHGFLTEVRSVGKARRAVADVVAFLRARLTVRQESNAFGDRVCPNLDA